jgi:DNA polymerase III delta subunit
VAAPLFFFHGSDEFLLERSVQQEAAACGPAANLEIVDGRVHSSEEWDRLLGRLGDGLSTPPLLAPSGAVWVREASFLAVAPAAGEEAAIETFFSLLERAGRWSVPVFISASRVDRRLRTVKRLTAWPAAIVLEVPGSGPRDLEPFLAKELQRRALAMSPAVAAYFLELVGGPARSIFSELDKLELAIHPGRTVFRNDVEAVCCAGLVDNFFAPVEAYYERDEPALAREMRRFLAEKGEPRALLAALQSRCRMLLQMKALTTLGVPPGQGRGPSTQAAKEHIKRHCLFADGSEVFSQNAFYLRNLAPQLSRWTLESLEHARASFLEIFQQLLRPEVRSPGWWLSMLALP